MSWGYRFWAKCRSTSASAPPAMRGARQRFSTFRRPVRPCAQSAKTWCVVCHRLGPGKPPCQRCPCERKGLLAKSLGTAPGVARRKDRAARTLLVRTALSRWVPDRSVSQRSAATSAPREEAYFFFFLAFFLGAFLAAFFRFLATVRPPKKVSARSVSVTSKSQVCSERVLPETKPKSPRGKRYFVARGKL